MNTDFGNDWRTQLDSKYNEYEYNEFLHHDNFNRSLESTHESKYDESDTNSTNAQFDAIRFPPCAKTELPDPIFSLDYEDNSEPRTLKNGSINSSDSIAGLDFLEALFQTVVGKAVDIRNSIIEHGKYIYFLSSPPNETEIAHMKSTVIDNLMLLRDESLQLINEMTIFQPEKVNDMIHQDVQSGKDIIKRRKTSLLRRSSDIKQEVTESAIVVDSLIHYSNSMVSFPTGPVCKLDGIRIDWTKYSKMQQKILTSNRSVNFASHMISKGHAVCGPMYRFLQSTKSYANTLEIVDYAFQPGEFMDLIGYLEKQHADISRKRMQPEATNQAVNSILESIHSLVVFNCGVTDRDCHVLSKQLKHLTNMHTLVLSSNKITCSGITSIATAIFEVGSAIRCLRVDNNSIKKDGLAAITEVLHRMPCLEILSLSGNRVGNKGVYKLLRKCMNPHRKAYLSLPKPSRQQRLDFGGSSIAESDSFDDDEGDEDEDENDKVTEEENEDVDVSKLLQRSKTNEQCYFSDYFARVAEQNSNMLRALFESNAHNAGWMTAAEDEFHMDTRSEYSEIDPDEQDDLNREIAEKLRIAKENEPTVLTEAELRLTYPKVIQALLRVRVKLVAINAFLRLLRKGCMLSSLNVSNCGLNSGVAETIAHAVCDNKNINYLDLSNNEQLLDNVASCTAVSTLLERSGLTTLKLNNCGVNDYAVMLISKSAMNGKTINNLELSDNYIGPTGANWIATASKTFYVDVLSLKGGFHKTAPFVNVNHESNTMNRDHQFIDTTYDTEERRRRNKSRNRHASVSTSSYLQDEDDYDEEPYLDTDTFEGDDDLSDDEGRSRYSDEDDEDDNSTRFDEEEEVVPEVKKKRFGFGIL